ncbi:MAG TPA: hypothetical protein VHZ32_07405 [Rhizomicrobium sp.]|jgi:hypothetical protein|nr:hypothetical protein [Rhizomicrobium sp.]
MGEAGMGYVKDGIKRYRLEVVTALVLFFAAGWLRRTAIHYTSDPTLLLVVKLLPLLPILLIGWAVWRFYGKSDELQRQTMLRMAGATGLLSLIVLMAWTVMQSVGFPPLTAETAILVISICCLLCGAVIKFLEGRAEAGLKEAFLRMMPVLCLAVLLPGLYAVLRLALPVHSTPFLWSVLWMGGALVIMALYWLLKRRFDS